MPDRFERGRHEASRGISVVAAGRRYAVRASDAGGFEVPLALAARLPGHVEIHEGGRLVRRALIVAEGPRGDAMRYAIKRATAARAAAPPVDYELAPASA